jgi:hypothetical protein
MYFFEFFLLVVPGQYVQAKTMSCSASSASASVARAPAARSMEQVLGKRSRAQYTETQFETERCATNLMQKMGAFKGANEWATMPTQSPPHCQVPAKAPPGVSQVQIRKLNRAKTQKTAAAAAPPAAVLTRWTKDKEKATKDAVVPKSSSQIEIARAAVGAAQKRIEDRRAKIEIATATAATAGTAAGATTAAAREKKGKQEKDPPVDDGNWPCKRCGVSYDGDPGWTKSKRFWYCPGCY